MNTFLPEQAAKQYGFYFIYEGLENKSAEEIAAGKAELMDKMQKLLPHTTVLSCGNSITINDISEIDETDRPCPCGDPNHWLIKYDVRKSETGLCGIEGRMHGHDQTRA